MTQPTRRGFFGFLGAAAAAPLVSNATEAPLLPAAPPVPVVEEASRITIKTDGALWIWRGVDRPMERFEP